MGLGLVVRGNPLKIDDINMPVVPVGEVMADRFQQGGHDEEDAETSAAGVAVEVKIQGKIMFPTNATEADAGGFALCQWYWTKCLVPLVSSSKVKIQGKTYVSDNAIKADAGGFALCQQDNVTEARVENRLW